MRTDVELLRIISAFGIVWFHSGHPLGRDVAYAGLVVFIIFTSYFAARSKKTYSVWDRGVRFLVPCIIWSLIYTSLDVFRGQPVFPNDYTLFSKVFTTPSIHLWYLPFAFFCVVLIDKIKYLNAQIVALTAALIASILLISALQWRQWSYPSPLGQYMHALPAVLIGISLALYSKATEAQKYLLISALTLSIITILTFQLPGISTTYTVGICASLLLLRDKSVLQKNRVIISIAKLSFGIYLLHPLILFVLRHVGVDSVLLPILAFIVSALCIYLVSKWAPLPLKKYLV